jgi:hypothetical protein
MTQSLILLWVLGIFLVLAGQKLNHRDKISPKIIERVLYDAKVNRIATKNMP